MNTTFKDILNIIFMYMRYIVVFTLIVVTFTSIYIFFAKKSYVSNAQVLIRLGQEQMGSMQFMSNSQNVYVTRREQELKNEEMIFLSDKVITSAAQTILGEDAKSFELLTSVKEYLGGHLKVKALFESDTLEISFSFPDPIIAQRVLGILIDKYNEHHISVFENTKELNFVRYKLKESREQYDNALINYTEFIDGKQIYGGNQIEFLVDKRNKMKTDIANVEAEHQYHVKKLNRSEEVLKTLQPYQKFNSVEVINDRRNSLKSKLNEARLEKQNLLQMYTSESRLVLDLDKEIEMIEALIIAEPDRVVDSVDSRKNDTYWTTHQSIIDLKTTVAGEEGKLASLKEELRVLEAELSANAKNLQQFTLLEKDLDLAKVSYEKYYEGFLESDLSNVSKSQDVTNISLIESPSLNPLEDWPNKRKILIFTGVFMIAGNFFLVMLASLLNNTATTPDDLERQLGSQPVATIPMATSNGDKHEEGEIGLNYYEQNLKDFQRLSINLTTAAENEKVFLVGRSKEGEGGSTISFNLAAFMANYQDRRVAFVDYQPSRITKAVSARTMVMEGVFEMGQLFKVDYFRYLDGNSFPRGDMKEKYAKLDQIKTNYDYIFCNIPPVRDSADLVFLNHHVDRIIFFVEAERTKMQVVKHNINTMAHYGFSRISLVLNKRRFHIPTFLYKYV